ncbi:MAG: response regulator [Candidatus Omnitrophica bacterium]|nr:response regulator [Candidatus Omnitrophota bacterium]
MSRILVVDDESEMVLVLKRFFNRQGFDVLTASRGQIALDIIEQTNHGIDLMILDMRMPGKRGIAVLLEIKKKSLDVPVIILTGSLNYSGFVEIMLTLGFTEEDVLYKPVSLEKLLNVANRKLDKQKDIA